jgi:hypothetical protein
MNFGFDLTITEVEGGSGEELITEVLDLDRVSVVRERGTRGLNPLMKEIREASPAFLDEHARLLSADDDAVDP